MLTASVDGKRRQGHPFRTIHDSFVENTQTIIPEVDTRGRFGDWIGNAKVLSNGREWLRWKNRERGV